MSDDVKRVACGGREVPSMLRLRERGRETVNVNVRILRAGNRVLTPSKGGSDSRRVIFLPDKSWMRYFGMTGICTI